MTGRKSSRGAAVVLAGCVGLALVAPGLAVAQVAAPTDCVITSDPTCVTDSTGSASTTGTTTPATPETSTPSTGGTADSGAASLPVKVPAVTDPETAGTGTPSSGSTTSGSTTSGSTSGAETTGSGSTGAGTGTAGTTATPVVAATPQAVAAGTTTLQNQLATLLPGLPTLPALPTTPGNLQFPTGFQVPTSIPTGGFTNPQQACAFLAGSVTVPASDAAGLGAAFAQFCGALPTSFDPSGLGGLTDLLDQLKDLLGGLVPTLPGTGTVNGDGTIPSNPPATAPDYSHGYWKKHYDVDCDDLTHDEAQAIFDADRSDPFRLDGDDDGKACEDGSTVVNVNNYSGYPKGGVSTGDGTAATAASPAEVALAAMTLSLLALGGVALVRRFGQEA